MIQTTKTYRVCRLRTNASHDGDEHLQVQKGMSLCCRWAGQCLPYVFLDGEEPRIERYAEDADIGHPTSPQAAHREAHELRDDLRYDIIEVRFG